jgi:dTDP-4-dehydrorhamnose 3,5-epimerase
MTADVVMSDVIRGVAIVRPQVFGDARGLFVETYRKEWLPDAREMVQSNRGDRQQGALVGLHFHRRQADYWYVVSGHARVVLHDLRAGSPTDGATLALDLGDVAPGSNDHTGVYIPPGVAHGFAALTDLVLTYLVDRYYDPDDELGIAWNDPAVAADWGVVDPILSERDRTNPARAALPESRRPRWEESS